MQTRRGYSITVNTSHTSHPFNKSLVEWSCGMPHKANMHFTFVRNKGTQTQSWMRIKCIHGELHATVTPLTFSCNNTVSFQVTYDTVLHLQIEPSPIHCPLSVKTDSLSATTWLIIYCPIRPPAVGAVICYFQILSATRAADESEWAE